MNNIQKAIEKFNPGSVKIDSSKRPSVCLGDLDGMADDAKKYSVINIGGIKLTILVDSEKDVYGKVDGQEVGYIMKMEDGTDATVVNEYQKKGIGTELAKVFHKLNPKAISGGMTDAGEKLYRKAMGAK